MYDLLICAYEVLPLMENDRSHTVRGRRRGCARYQRRRDCPRDNHDAVTCDNLC